MSINQPFENNHIYTKKYYGHKPLVPQKNATEPYFNDYGRLIKNTWYSYHLSENDTQKHIYTMFCDIIRQEYTIYDVINDEPFFIVNYDNDLPICSGKSVTKYSINDCQKVCKSHDCACYLSTDVKELEELGYVNIDGHMQKKMNFFKENGFTNE